MDYSIFVKIAACLARQRNLPTYLFKAAQRAMLMHRIVDEKPVYANNYHAQKILAWLQRFPVEERRVNAFKLYLLYLYKVGEAIDGLKKGDRERVCLLLVKSGIKCVF